MNIKSKIQEATIVQLEHINPVEVSTPSPAERPNFDAVRETVSGSSIFSPRELPSRQQSAHLTVGEGVVRMLEELGVRYAFGVSGGGIGPLWATLEQSSIRVLHFRHEAGASFAAVGS